MGYHRDVPRDWEAWLATASGPASPTEEEERDRTLDRVRRAITAASDIASSVSVYVKGSYATRTNVRRDADVDIAVEWRNTFRVDTWGKTAGMTAAQLGYTPVSEPVTPTVFRKSVDRALLGAFGSRDLDVSPDKHISVASTSSTLEADVVPCFGMHRYDDVGRFVEGHRIYPKSGGCVDNFPKQHYDNGVRKNTATRRRYKEIVRCTKRLITELFELGLLRRDYPGYLTECLLYNVPNDRYGQFRRYDDLSAALQYLQAGLASADVYNAWTEPSELVMLFRGHADRKATNALNILNTALNRLTSA